MLKLRRPGGFNDAGYGKPPNYCSRISSRISDTTAIQLVSREFRKKTSKPFSSGSPSDMPISSDNLRRSLEAPESILKESRFLKVHLLKNCHFLALISKLSWERLPHPYPSESQAETDKRCISA